MSGLGPALGCRTGEGLRGGRRRCGRGTDTNLGRRQQLLFAVRARHALARWEIVRNAKHLLAMRTGNIHSFTFTALMMISRAPNRLGAVGENSVSDL